MTGRTILGLMAAAALMLAGCDNGPSAVQGGKAGENHSAATRDGGGGGGGRGDGAQDRDARDKPKSMVDGKTIWASSRRYSAEENARRAFERNGADFGARDMEDFARKARAFGERPPSGVQSLVRANGDRLLYDPKGNVFAVITRDGAPRAMFKPDDGATYWEEQKTREANSRASGRSRNRDDAA